MVPFVHGIVRELMAVLAAVTATDVRAHVGYLELAKATSSLQRARALCLCPCTHLMTSSTVLLASWATP